MIIHLIKRKFHSGIDLETGQSVAIKFATEELFYSLEQEYVNYLYLGADGKNFEGAV